MDVAAVNAWLDAIHHRHLEFDYRYIYAAYLAASDTHAQPHGEVTMSVDAHGGYLLRVAGHDDSGLRLCDDADRQAFIDHLHRRYCGDRYPNMDAWEADQHAGYLEDARWYFGHR